MDISAGDKLTIITSTHVLVCTVAQIRGRSTFPPPLQSGQDQDRIPLQSGQPEANILPDQSEANILLEIEVQDVITKQVP